MQKQYTTEEKQNLVAMFKNETQTSAFVQANGIIPERRNWNPASCKYRISWTSEHSAGGTQLMRFNFSETKIYVRPGPALQIGFCGQAAKPFKHVVQRFLINL